MPLDSSMANNTTDRPYVGWPSEMISRCICDVSISMNPSPMAMKNDRSGAVPASVTRSRVSHSGSRMQRAVNSDTVISRAPSVATAFMLWLSAPKSRREKLMTSRSRSMLKKNGLSSVGAAMLIG